METSGSSDDKHMSKLIENLSNSLFSEVCVITVNNCCSVTVRVQKSVCGCGVCVLIQFANPPRNLTRNPYSMTVDYNRCLRRSESDNSECRQDHDLERSTLERLSALSLHTSCGRSLSSSATDNVNVDAQPSRLSSTGTSTRTRHIIVRLDIRRELLALVQHITHRAQHKISVPLSNRFHPTSLAPTPRPI